MPSPGAGPLFGVAVPVAAIELGWTLAIAAAVVLGLMVLTYLPGVVLRVSNERWLRARSKGKLVLTFDDGPSPISTARILDVLDEFGAKATFFVLGCRAAEHPEICEFVRQRGHEIGSHSEDHQHAWHRPLRAIADVLAGCRTVARWVGPTRFFRPPFGKVNLWSYLALRLSGYHVVVWTLDPQDSLDQALPLDEVEQLLRRDGGGVAVLHDLDWEGQPARVDHTLAATRRLLTVAGELGLRTCTMSELFRRETGGSR